MNNFTFGVLVGVVGLSFVLIVFFSKKNWENWNRTSFNPMAMPIDFEMAGVKERIQAEKENFIKEISELIDTLTQEQIKNILICSTSDIKGKSCSRVIGEILWELGYRKIKNNNLTK